MITWTLFNNYLNSWLNECKDNMGWITFGLDFIIRFPIHGNIPHNYWYINLSISTTLILILDTNYVLSIIFYIKIIQKF